MASDFSRMTPETPRREASFEETLARYRAVALERLEQIEVGWLALVNQGDQAHVAELFRSVQALKTDSRSFGFADVALLAHKLEELLYGAARIAFEVPEDFDLVVTMAIRFMAMLVRKRAGMSLGGIDLAGFLTKIDESLRDVSAAPRRARAPVDPRAASPARDLERLVPDTRAALVSSATTIFLEYVSASGPVRERLGGIWRELRAALAALSLEPIAPRLARHTLGATRLARDLGKELTVESRAGAACIPVDAAEALDTALLHALRNAVDHGIEPPDVRRAHDKSPTGLVRITARSSADATEITVSDDGRGIDLDAVRAIGVRRGFLAPEHAATATSASLLELLFQPGFSTSDQVSDVSGRGVGMDAIRAALARCGGTATLRTRAGDGTTITFRIPRCNREQPVHTFRARRGDLPLAVPASWSIARDEPGDAAAIDPVALLGVRLAAGDPSPTPHLLTLARDGVELVLATGGPARTCLAERLWPRCRAVRAEVVLVEAQEAALILSEPERGERAAARPNGQVPAPARSSAQPWRIRCPNGTPTSR